MVKMFIIKKEVELSENELNQILRNILMGSVQMLELLVTTELLGYPISNLKRYKQAILKNLGLLESAGTQVTDSILVSELTFVTNAMRLLLDKDDAIALWIKEKYQVNEKQLGVMRRRGKRPIWLDSREYRAFLKDVIETLASTSEHYRNAFQRIKEILAPDGLNVEDHQVDALLNKIKSVPNIMGLSL